MSHRFTNQTHPLMTWEQGKIGEDSCMTTSCFSGAIARVRVTQPYHFGEAVDADVEVLFRDGREYTWKNNRVSTVYNGQFGISVSPDGRFVFVQTWDRGLFCYDSGTGKQVWRTGRRFGITNMCVNASTVLVHQHDRALQLLDMETGEVIKEKKPARAWGFYCLDSGHLICHTCARQWEIIRASDLETVQIIPAKQFPDDSWCIRNVYLENGKVKYEAFRNVWENGTMLPNEETEGYIEIYFQEVTP